MSDYVPDTTARELPQLPPAWQTDDESGDANAANAADLDEVIRTLAAEPTDIDDDPIAKASSPPPHGQEPAAAPADNDDAGPRAARTAGLAGPPKTADADDRAVAGSRAPKAAPPSSKGAPERVEEESTHRVTPGGRRSGVRGRRLPLPGAPPPPAVPPPQTAAPPAMAPRGRMTPQAPSSPARAQPAPGSVATPRPPANRAAPSRPVERQVAGRYRIVERIGQGGMGKVFKVTHTQLGKTFALKIIGEQLAQTDEARELFYREARLASSLSHPNITSVVDFGEDNELGLFMVMELVEGVPLAKVLHRDGRLSVRMACEIALQIAEALRYIHSNHIVHCDIKTENILLSEQHGSSRRQLHVKLLDFGLARSLNSGRNTSSLSGTPHYVAPERIRGEPASPASDIYGVGILLYEMVTGKVPWDGHIAQILAGHVEQAPTPPSQLIEGGLDPAVESLILHALAKTPAARHKDMAAFIYELRTVMDMLGFGRRTRRSGRRVVLERSKNERADLARHVFETCRLPLALVNPSGLIVIANPSFARFVMGVSVDVEGLTVQSTPLAGCWSTFEVDLARAVSGQAVRRVLEMDVPGGETRRLLMWLDRAPQDHVVLGVQPLDL